jgi:hypothetical protein
METDLHIGKFRHLASSDDLLEKGNVVSEVGLSFVQLI